MTNDLTLETSQQLAAPYGKSAQIQDMQHILQKLVSFHTVTDDPQSQHEALDYIASYMAQHGLHVERYDSNGYESMVATTVQGRKTPTVMLAAHLDVTPAPDEDFELREAAGRLYGRGTLDMKFAIATYMQIVKELGDNLDQYDLGIMITTDEEVGGFNGTKCLVDEGYIPKVCILPDGGDDWQIQLSSKGFYYLTLQTFGTPAHGSRPWLGNNAIQTLMKALQDIEGLFGESTAENSTMNIGIINGGGAVNQVADHATASIDIRARTEAEKQQLLAQVRTICKQYGVELTVNLDGIATRFDLDNPLIASFAQTITAVTGVPVLGSHTLGSNDTRFMVEHGVPCISVYPPGGGHHGPEEWVSKEGFYQFKDILSRYIDHIARKH